MPQLISSATRIPVPGGKTIDEHVGAVNTGHDHVSIAHMVAPPGWTEPAQVPEFEEHTLVLRGTLLVDHDGGRVRCLLIRLGCGSGSPCHDQPDLQHIVRTDDEDHVGTCREQRRPCHR